MPTEFIIHTCRPLWMAISYRDGFVTECRIPYMHCLDEAASFDKRGYLGSATLGPMNYQLLDSTLTLPLAFTIVFIALTSTSTQAEDFCVWCSFPTGSRNIVTLLFLSVHPQCFLLDHLHLKLWLEVTAHRTYICSLWGMIFPAVCQCRSGIKFTLPQGPLQFLFLSYCRR